MPLPPFSPRISHLSSPLISPPTSPPTSPLLSPLTPPLTSVNAPGAAAGNVHLDGDHLLATPKPGAAAPPPHCLTVFIPLVDVDGETNVSA